MNEPPQVRPENRTLARAKRRSVLVDEPTTQPELPQAKTPEPPPPPAQAPYVPPFEPEPRIKEASVTVALPPVQSAPPVGSMLPVNAILQKVSGQNIGALGILVHQEGDVVWCFSKNPINPRGTFFRMFPGEWAFIGEAKGRFFSDRPDIVAGIVAESKREDESIRRAAERAKFEGEGE